ncbi:MAG: TIGR03621 family F420-dependent LLM class oxidoreductase [Ilumatobacteraceae bacterium]
MTSRHPFRFGVQASTAAGAAEWTALARTAEKLGYSTLTMPDHFGDQLAPVPALMAAAAVTTTLRVGALVWDNDYKHPVVLAKELATIDVLSGGRLEIGLGAGWMASDYEQSGIPFDSNKVRVDRFEEGLAVIKGAMSGQPFSFSGQHYTLADFVGTPHPVQAPCPPLLIGGGGKRVLSIAAREADIIGINGTLADGVAGPEAIASMTADAVDQKVAIVHGAAGHRLDDIELNIRAFMVRVTDDRQAAIQQVADFVQVDPALVVESPFALVGTPAEMVDDLLRRRERWGFTYVIVGAEDVESFAPVVAALAGH